MVDALYGNPEGRSDRPARDDLEIEVRDDRGNLEQNIFCRIEPRHLAVDPDEVLLAPFRFA